jgi:hypothetical protein
MTDLEKAARQALERLRRADKISGYPNNKLAIAALESALAQQAEPVDAPPKSFRVGYLTGYDDGQRELREKQQAEPVAWRTFDGEGGYDYRTYDDENYAQEWAQRNPSHENWVEPLYAAPQQAVLEKDWPQAVRESQQRARLDLRLAGRKKSTQAEAEFAVPHLVEDAGEAQQAEPVVWDPQCPLCGGSRPAVLAQQAEPVVDDASGNPSY